MRVRILLLATAALALAGCSKGGGAGNNSSDAATMQEQVPANLTIDPGNRMVPLPRPSPSPVSGIPPTFQGRWGMVGNDCRPERASAAEGLMVVSGDALTFYDSHATIAKADTIRPGTLSLKLDHVGEGRRWSDAETLTLVDPQTLVRDAKKPAGSFRYSRCPK